MAEFPSWQQGIRESHPPLRGTLRADAAIVGGGLTGVTTALMLQAQGVKTVLLEARRLGQGATFGCGGLVTCQAFHAYQAAAQAVAHGLGHPVQAGVSFLMSQRIVDFF